MFQQRQGDVWVTQVKEIPTDVKAYAKEGKRFVLAHGEVTGHAHALYTDTDTIEMFQSDDGTLWLRTSNPMNPLQHEEHGTLDIPNGVFKVTRQREYHPEAPRNVLD